MAGPFGFEKDKYFQFPDDGGSFAKAAVRCIGLGECRKQDSGTMCPSYMATLEEEQSTRGRAHMLFEVLQGEVVGGGWKDEHVKKSLDLCLSCKACKSECPTNVDVATYKAEFLAHYYGSGYSRSVSMVTSRWLVCCRQSRSWPETAFWETRLEILGVCRQVESNREAACSKADWISSVNRFGPDTLGDPSGFLLCQSSILSAQFVDALGSEIAGEFAPESSAYKHKVEACRHLPPSHFLTKQSSELIHCPWKPTVGVANDPPSGARWIENLVPPLPSESTGWTPKASCYRFVLEFYPWKSTLSTALMNCSGTITLCRLLGIRLGGKSLRCEASSHRCWG